jgi:hypothetical protein
MKVYISYPDGRREILDTLPNAVDVPWGTSAHAVHDDGSEFRYHRLVGWTSWQETQMKKPRRQTKATYWAVVPKGDLDMRADDLGFRVEVARAVFARPTVGLVVWPPHGGQPIFKGDAQPNRGRRIQPPDDHPMPDDGPRHLPRWFHANRALAGNLLAGCFLLNLALMFCLSC